MRDPKSANTLCSLLLTLPLALWSAATAAQSEGEPARGAESKVEEAGGGEPTSRFALSLKGFGGGLFAEEEQKGGGGGGLTFAFGVVPERFELELGLSLVATRDEDPLGVLEVVGKLLFETPGDLTPHLLLGPVFSLDFGHELKNSGGVLLGAGLTYWFHPRWGVVTDVAYRLLISGGPELEHVLTGALGVTFRF